MRNFLTDEEDVKRTQRILGGSTLQWSVCRATGIPACTVQVQSAGPFSITRSSCPVAGKDGILDLPEPNVRAGVSHELEAAFCGKRSVGMRRAVTTGTFECK